MGNDSQYVDRWEDFKKKEYLLHRLSDEEVNYFFEHASVKFLCGVNERDRFNVFFSERNNRNADKVARTGLMLAGVAVAVGLIQIALAFLPA